MENFKTLPELKPGESGIVVSIEGGTGSIRHLENLGLRTGKKITKLSAHIWGGPQVIKIDNMRIALGFGMSKKVRVKIQK